MSHKQKMTDLRQRLERWKSHNEVHAKPADQALYEFLSELLKIGEVDELPEPVQSPVENHEPPQAINADDETGPGGNHPSDPSGNP
jgi:hypothetical protein